MPKTAIERRLYVYSAYLTFPKKNEVTGLYDDAQADVRAVMNYVDALPKDLDCNPSNYVRSKSGDEYNSFTVEYEDDNYVLGQFATTRLYGVPKLEGGGVRVSMPLPEGKGPYEPSHFAYFIKDRRIVYETNVYAPQIAKLAKYLEEKSASSDADFVNSAIFTPLVRGENVDFFLNGLGGITELEIEVPETHVETVKNQDLLLGEALQSAQKLSPDSRRFSIVLRAELHQRKGGFAQIKQTVGRLAREFPSIFTRIKGKGKPSNDPTGSAIAFDLLKDKLTSTVNVQIDHDRHVVSEDMFEKIIEFYNSIQSDLQK